MSSKPTTNDGVEFFNAQDNNGNYKSSLGYYKSVTHPAGTPPDVLIDISNGYTHWEGQNEQGEKHTLAILAMVQTTSNVSSFILSNIPRRRCFLLVHQC